MRKKYFSQDVSLQLFYLLQGASMTYFFILPYSLAFTIEFSFNVLGLDVYRPEAGNYYSTIIWMTFAVGIAFQFPLVLILLIKIGILSVRKLRENRRLVLVILMISAALITPGGDPVSLCILTIPLYILYELGHFNWLNHRNKEKKKGVE
jgi:sec-independent protein translocase protein TatC